tara:strand:+ start:1967 stop:2110 length:144 start_codon:yes stop_codon:yes gene_type:complete
MTFPANPDADAGDVRGLAAVHAASGTGSSPASAPPVVRAYTMNVNWF